MTQENHIKKMVEHILQNIEKVSSIGLYNGKAGLSLSLFLASRTLKDEHLEKIAFRLLQESLIIKSSDVSFENGLAGIGYTLLYLIENKYIEANFDEIFEDQYEILLKSFADIEKNPLTLINSLQVIYFLSKVYSLKNEDDRLQVIVRNFFEGLELFLTVHFLDFEDIHYINKKNDVLNIYKTYLKLVNYSGYDCFSHTLLKKYTALYQKRRVLSSLEIGFYLNKIASKYNIGEYGDVINDNINNGIENMNIDTLSLKERIDMLRIINDIGVKNISECVFIPEIVNMQNMTIIQDLSLKIGERSSPFGYGAGLARLLIYCVNKQTELL